jgi:2-polyprenyl-3-methyl-5-hydroxy-6-metoxy-1,4-benzoquinol methylase
MAESDFVLARACRICGSDLFPILDMGRQPLANALVSFPSDSVAYFPLAVVGCAGCGVMQLSGTVDPHLMFDDYLYFSSYSESMVSAMGQLARSTVARFGLGPGDLVMEIASNDGYLLRHYLQMGIPVLGVEPAANVARVAQAAGIETRVEYFTSELAAQLAGEGHRPRVIHANNVLAHVPQIHDLVEAMAVVLADDGVVIVETPSLIDLIDRALFETIYHEHVFYYSLSALTYLFREHGLSIQDCERLDVHGGSLRVTARKGVGIRATSRAEAALAAEASRSLQSSAAYGRFVTEVLEQRAEVIDQFAQVRASGRELAGYGAAAKATVLLNFTGIDHGTIDYVVDRNPAKQSRIIPGTGIPVRSPEHLREHRPDVLAVLVWNLADEVRSQLRWFTDSGGELIVPLEERRAGDRRPSGHSAPSHP